MKTGKKQNKTEKKNKTRKQKNSGFWGSAQTSLVPKYLHLSSSAFTIRPTKSSVGIQGKEFPGQIDIHTDKELMCAHPPYIRLQGEKEKHPMKVRPRINALGRCHIKSSLPDDTTVMSV